ncbi:hypothetical protein ACFL1U_02620 [Patescibacteria group bacterium]
MREKWTPNSEEEGKTRDKIKKDLEKGYQDFVDILEKTPGLWEYIQEKEEKRKREEDRRPQLEIPAPGTREPKNDQETKEVQTT